MRQKNRLNCFSPPVMIATMVVESALAIYTVWRYKMTPLVRLATLTLGMLATFQLAEYFVCTGSVGHAEFWSRVGFSAIATLPVLGLHLVHKVAEKPVGRLVTVAYASMAAFIVFFMAFPAVFENYQCTGNYVVFHLRPRAGGIFWVLYMAWIFTSIFLGARWANEFMQQNKSRKLNAIRGLLLGWMAFLIPTAIANIVNPATRTGIPSVMCGFAVLFALILALYVMPRAAEAKALTKLAK
ncbi:MAG TPA: hypothetical protein VH234_05985 [Candidatus Saccharimonadales bacterium]|jgi:hypothetical protein|nr:hypothetical protein [Candidatus Saccharimonadales bacterium]